MTREQRLKIIGDDTIRKVELKKGDDVMTVSVLDNGRYRADVVGSISSVNHGSADSALKDIARFLGGKLSIMKNAHGHHHHAAGHAHEHSH
jgi:hypothetical protein